jgi:hypothetical protein
MPVDAIFDPVAAPLFVGAVAVLENPSPGSDSVGAELWNGMKRPVESVALTPARSFTPLIVDVDSNVVVKTTVPADFEIRDVSVMGIVVVAWTNVARVAVWLPAVVSVAVGPGGTASIVLGIVAGGGGVVSVTTFFVALVKSTSV